MPRSRNSRPPTRQRPSTGSRAGVELEKFTTADLRTWQRQSENLERYNVQIYYHLEGLRSLYRVQLSEALSDTKPTQFILKDWVRFWTTNTAWSRSLLQVAWFEAVDSILGVI